MLVATSPMCGMYFKHLNNFNHRSHDGYSKKEETYLRCYGSF